MDYCIENVNNLPCLRKNMTNATLAINLTSSTSMAAMEEEAATCVNDEGAEFIPGFSDVNIFIQVSPPHSMSSHTVKYK